MTTATQPLTAERVRQPYHAPGGGVEFTVFWIAYPGHIAAYAHTSDRISHAWGSGRTRKAALADANAFSGCH